jgi:UTP--glucose-1-phosphate uridylyltransferase
MKKITKAVFPVAGLGTRFLPATKATPKEMLSIVDKPLIQFAVEEAIAAGATELIFITSSTKRAIEDHFDSNFELEYKLREQKKFEVLEQVQKIIPDHVSCVYIRQKEALGLGHAVLCAKEIVGDDHFFVSLADDLIYSQGKNCLEQMRDFYEKHQANVVAVQQVPTQELNKYGVIDVKENAQCMRIENIVEKPVPEKAPSNFGVTGRYLFSAKIFEYLEKTEKGSGGEIQLTDAIQKLLSVEPVYGYVFEGKRYDCGSKLGFLEATVEYALRHPELKASFHEYLKTIK